MDVPPSDETFLGCISGVNDRSALTSGFDDNLSSGIIGTVDDDEGVGGFINDGDDLTIVDSTGGQADAVPDKLI